MMFIDEGLKASVQNVRVVMSYKGTSYASGSNRGRTGAAQPVYHQSAMSINELTLVTAKLSGNGSSLEETRAATSVSSFFSPDRDENRRKLSLAGPELTAVRPTTVKDNLSRLVLRRRETCCRPSTKRGR